MRISLRTKVVASYVGIIVFTVLTVMVAHDQFMRSWGRSNKEALDHLTAATTAVQQAIAHHEPLDRLEERLSSLDSLTPFRSVVIATRPTFPYKSMLEKFTLTPEDRQKLSQGEDVVGMLRQRMPHLHGMFAMRAVGPDGLVLTYHVIPHHPDDWRLKLSMSVLRSVTIAMVLALAASLPLAAHLTKPIRKLEKVARRFAQGDLDARADLRRRDEIGLLGGAFDHMADNLQHNIETRTRLLSDVSHELATPVTTIRATVEALLDGVVPEGERNRYLESLLSQVEHLSYLLNDVTELARFETGQISLEMGRFAAREPLAQAAEPARLLKHPVEVQNCADDVMVEGDSRRILQVLQNLVSNAIHHNPPGTRVTVTCEARADHVVYSVADDGPPIPESEKERIFERFHKLDTARSRSRVGAGLGLAIVRQILEGHHTTISLEPGKKFVFTLRRVV